MTGRLRIVWLHLRAAYLRWRIAAAHQDLEELHALLEWARADLAQLPRQIRAHTRWINHQAAQLASTQLELEER